MSEFESVLEVDGQEISVIIAGDYQPYEAATRDYPGCDERATITTIEVVMDDLWVNLLPVLSKDTIGIFEAQLIEREAAQYERRSESFAQIARSYQEEALRESEQQRGVRI